MIELKIQCAHCGQKYKFDVEPSNGRISWLVQCPVCKTDGTETANTSLAALPQARPVQVAPGGPVPASMRVGAPAVAQPAVSVPEIPPLSPPRAPSMVAPAKKPAAGSNFGLGVCGAIGGALLGMIGWYLLIRLTLYTIGYAAIGVGALAGLGARVLAKQGSHSLGIVAAVCGVVAILLGQFLAMKSLTSIEIAKMLEGAYDGHMVYAKEAVAAKTDDEIKAVLVKSEDSDASDAASIDAKSIQKFRQSELPKLQKFINGSPGKAEYQLQQQSKIEELVGPLVFKETFRLRTILWIFLGVGSAYRVANKS